MREIFLLLIIVFLFSCQNKNNNYQSNSDVYIINLDNIETEQSLSYSSVFGKMKTIILDATEEALINTIYKMDVYNECIIILDIFSAKGVFVFNNEGKFIRKIGSRGGGPGEYSSPTDFTVDSERGEIYVLDSDLQYIYKYTISSGEYLSTIDISSNDGSRINKIHYVNNVLYADAFFPYNPSDENYLLQTIDASGKQVDNYFTASETNKGWHNVDNVNSGTFYYTGKRSLFVQHLMDTVMNITPNFVTPFLVVESKDLIVPNDIDKIDISVPGSLIRLNKISNLTRFIEHKDFIFFMYHKGLSVISVLYDQSSGYAKQYKLVNDDFLYSGKNYMKPRFGCVDEKGIYNFFDCNRIGEFVLNVNEGLCAENLDKKEELMKLNEDSNPVIFYYEFKE